MITNPTEEQVLELEATIRRLNEEVNQQADRIVELEVENEELKKDLKSANLRIYSLECTVQSYHDDGINYDPQEDEIDET